MCANTGCILAVGSTNWLLDLGMRRAAFAAARWDRRALWLVVVALALNWFGDSLDGTLARVRRVERPRYGFYVDHVLDIAGATLLFGGLACSPFMTPVIALALLVAYLLVAGEVFLATAVRGVFRMSFAGVGPTDCASCSRPAPWRCCAIRTCRSGRLPSGCSTSGARSPRQAARGVRACRSLRNTSALAVAEPR